ncbi:MAG: hypothetical protein CR997_05345 [Acidobacteria bacterium]|nr:MAG: hypothetical protein CR997_05345 [Acidobacteriota bacterium]
MKWKTIILVLFIVFFGFFVMNYLAGMKEAPKKKAAGSMKRLVRVMEIETRTLEPELVVHGMVRSTESIDVITEVSGTTAECDIRILPGSKFSKGDCLLVIDERQAYFRMQTLKSDYLNALATLLPEIKFEFPEVYPEWLSYFERCHSEKVLPDMPETDQTKIKLLLSRFGVSKLFYQIKNQEVDLEKHVITVPFDGVILESYLSPGAAVRAGTKVARIIDMSRIECELDIPSDQLEFINREGKIRVSSNTLDQPFEATFLRVGGEINPKTRTLAVFVKPVSRIDGNLLEGAFLSATLQFRPIANAVEIPIRLLRSSDSVYVVEDGILVERSVHVAQKTASQAIIDSGLKDGDLLVVDLLQGVAPGSSVNTQIQKSEAR